MSMPFGSSSITRSLYEFQDGFAARRKVFLQLRKRPLLSGLGAKTGRADAAVRPRFGQRQFL